MLLGSGRRVQAREGRVWRGVRLLGRRCGHRALWRREHRHDRACRVGADHLRSVADFIWRAVADLLFGGARSDPVEPPGSGRGESVPFGDLLRYRDRERDRTGLYRSAEQGPRLLPSHRDPGGAVRALLSRGGVSPELSRATPRPAVHRLQRPAESATAAAAVPRALQAVTSGYCRTRTASATTTEPLAARRSSTTRFQPPGNVHVPSVCQVPPPVR